MKSRLKEFPELISSFLKTRISELKKSGKTEEALKLENQYKFDKLEDDIDKNSTARHYEADSEYTNIERLYAHHCCVEINFVCKAHCRYCLRSNYTKWTITDQGIKEVVDYVNREKLTEILVTGGDPFLTPKILLKLIKSLEKCKSLKIIRIATRVITQDPEFIINNKSGILDVLEYGTKKFGVEVATQINTYVELDHEYVQKAIKLIRSFGITIYSQNVFLKGVNNTTEDLIKLYTAMRYSGIESHYLFHCCNIKGAAHFRTSVHDMVRCYEGLVNSGSISGRCKPLMALMTCIGKIVITDLNACEYKGDSLILRSRYKLEDRLMYNPKWKLPADAWVDKDGYLWCEYRGEALQERIDQ